MKLLYTVIISFAFSFAQPGRLFLSVDNAMNINFDKICDGYIEYSMNKNGIVSFKSIEIDKVCALYLDDGTEIISTPECFINNSTESIAHKGKRGRIGRLFIAGGGYLIYAPFHDLFHTEDDDSFGYSWNTFDSDYYYKPKNKSLNTDYWKYAWGAGVVLMSIGGVLVAMGI